MRTVASEVETPEVGGKSRPQSRSVAARKSRLRRMALEGLEARTLLSTSTLPAATAGTPVELNPTSSETSGNSSSPQIAIDRYNPNKLVSVWVQDIPGSTGTQKVFVEGAYSNDGGAHWTDFNAAPPTLTDPDSPSTGTYVFSQVTDPDVGFDTNNDVYIMVDEHSTDPLTNSGPASGAIVLEKFDFSGSAPQRVPFTNIYSGNQQNYNVLYQWANSVDAIASPTMAVDDNQASFMDPTTEKTQTDPYSNNVYVAWATNTNAPNGASNYNANTIEMIASADGGQTFTAPTILNGNGYSGTEHDAAPQLAISQGRVTDTAVYGPTDTGVSGGLVTAVWDDFGSLTGSNRDEIWSTTVDNGGTADAFAGTHGIINKAIAGANGSPDSPVTTMFTADVNITDPSFTTLSDLSVSMNLLEPNGNNEISAVLIAPNGDQITLFTNAINSAGAATPFPGLGGNNLGIASSGQLTGTTFDDNASRTISDPTSAASYIGTYRPEFGSLDALFAGMTATELSGTWTLQITDNRADGTDPSPTLVNWSLNFTSGMTDQRNIPVATTPVRGSFDANFATTAPSTPNGIGPAVVIASDNTLGSFSPNEGTLYVAYVYRDSSVSSNPAANTDVALATSTDGGQSWTIMTDKVNDDNATTDGFSGSITPSDALNDTNEETGNSQYMPAITVDQATGTLVLSWRDARYDAGDARVVTAVTTSIDGGQTFSPDVYANADNTAVNAITGATVTVSPQQDNESAGNTATDATFGFGTKMGIVAFDGKVYAAWAGNANKQTVNGPVPLTIDMNPLVIAAGPRVVSSTMGPVGQAGDTLNTQTAPYGTPMATTIAVTFDRPIDPTAVTTKTFTTSAVEVFYNSTTGAPPVPLDVTSVKPIVTAGDPDNDGHFGYTQWLVTFNPTLLAGGAAPSNITDFTGTYSYLIKPVITDEVRSYQITDVASPVVVQAATAPNVPVAIPASGTGGTGTSADTIDSYLTLSGHPNQVITSLTANLSLTITNDYALDITLTAPNGVTVTLYDDPYSTGANFTNTTFSDAALSSILTASPPYTGTFQPADATGLTTNMLAAMDGGTVDGTWTLQITDNYSGNIGSLTNWSLTINSKAPTTTPTLQNGNLMDQNADGTGGEDATVTPYTGLTPGDVYAAPTPDPSVPVTYNLTPGSRTPFPQGPYNPTTLPLIVPGPSVVSTSVPSPEAQGTADNLVLNGTVSSLDLTFDRDMNSSSFTAAQILQIMGPSGLISGPQTYTLPTASQNVTIAGGSTTPIDSTITVPNDDSTFPLSSLSVQLNLLYQPSSDLTIYLVAPNGTKLLLMSGIGRAGLATSATTPTALTFSDAALSSILTEANAADPLSGTYTAQGGLLSSLIRPSGSAAALDAQGNWTLQITDNNTSKNVTGSLVSWSLIATPQLSVTPLMDGKGAGTSRTFRVNFPQQSLSGTYTVEIAPTIVSAAGDEVDSNLNAGVSVLFGEGTNNPTAQVTYSASNLPQTIPSAKTVGGTTVASLLTSTITVPDNFLVQGIDNGLSGLTVQVNITDASDPTLAAELVYDMGQAGAVTVPLFANVGNGPNAANFTNTVFDDQATTPIGSGGAPFFGTYSPVGSLEDFAGLSSAGTWTLVLTSTRVATGKTAAAKLNSWSLSFQKPLPTSGLGEPNADDISASFRIFTMDPTNTLAGDTWTAVGPAGINEEGGGVGEQVTSNGEVPVTNGGQIGAIAVDPSDPSGNTVYIGGASGGVWKTTDFLTNSPLGPTWIPLTDFGPTFSLNIGSIAIFPRNDNPNNSIIIASTGDGDDGSQGVGFLRSEDGGATWTLLDSTTNVDSSGNLLSETSTSRDHIFVGDTSFQVVVDPTPTVNGGVIIYAALSGPTGGIWRSEDTGNTWQLVLAGNATSVILAPDSATGGSGNLQIVYAGMANPAGSAAGVAAGVYISPDQGQVWNQMTGASGNPLIVNLTTRLNVNPVTTPNPNDANASRIVVVTPDLTGDPAEDEIYEGWLYAVVVGGSGNVDGLYETKDYGETWTQVSLPTLAPVNGFQQAVPTNNVSDGNYDVAGAGPIGNGLYDISLAVDPTDPNIVYLGGTMDGDDTNGNSSGLLRIDTTLIWDAHNTVYNDAVLNDGGGTNYTASAPLQRNNPVNVTGLESEAPVANPPTPPNEYIDLIHDPADPNESDATLYLVNSSAFTNNGAGVTWIPFDIGGTDIHRMVTEIDPVTGLPRLIVGDDQGIFTAVDNNGVVDQSLGNVVLASGTRNGNLQIQQFYYGAAQPSNLAATVAQALLYGSSDHDGGPESDPDVLTDGNITWNGTSPLGEFEPLGEDLGAAGVATNQQGGTGSTAATTAEEYQYWWPANYGGDYTNFFQVSLNGNTSISRTFGLLQSSAGLPTPDPQWVPQSNTNFTVNPLNGQQVIISAPGNNNGIGRIFLTENGGVTWQAIGQPTALDNSYAPALAFGAPDPSAPSGIGNLDNFIYAGTTDGNIFVTQTGGGASGNQWSNISTGLDGSTVEQIVTDPTRGSHDAYAVTQDGVYYIANSITLITDMAANAAATAAGTTPLPYTAAQILAAGWQNITNNLFELMFNALGNSSLTTNLLQPVAGQVNDPNRGTEDLEQVLEQDGGLDAIVADWRYAIPENPTEAASATNPAYPVLYVAGGAGVYQSLDNGQTWALFPSQVEGATQAGGLLPNAQVTALTLDLGNVAVNTGRAVQEPGDPDVLVATTFGRGDYAIRVGPEITPTSVALATSSVSGVTTNGGPLVTINDPVIDGFSEESAFGNTVTVTLYNMANPTVPIGTGQTNAYGQFAVQITPGTLTANGVVNIGVQATDSAGTVGNIVPLSFTLQTANLGQSTPPTPPTLALQASDDSSHGQDITNVTQPHLVGATSANAQVSLLDASGNIVPVVNPLNPTGPAVTSVTSNATTGAFSLQPYTPLNGNPPTVYAYRAEATNANGTAYSSYVTFTVATVGPTLNIFQGLALADDTGIQGDNITSDREPDFVGTTNPNAEVDLVNATTGVVLASTTADGSGAYTIQLPQDLTDGTIELETQVHDAAGNQGPVSAVQTVTIASVAGDYTGDGQADLALYQRTSATTGTWFIDGVTSSSGVVFGAGGADIPLTGDFNGDGISDLAYYQPSNSTFTIQLSGGGQLEGGSVQTIPLGQAGDIPVVGNFDGTGISEVGVFNPTSGTWTIDGTGGIETFQFGQSGDVPVPGNYDGTGKDELALYRPSTGQFLIAGPTSISTTTGGVTQITNPESIIVGTPNEVPDPAGYDNSFYFANGVAERTEPAVYNPNTGALTIFQDNLPLSSGTETVGGVTYSSPNGTTRTVTFEPGDIIASGDYDGTGNAEPAVYRPGTSQFIVDGATGTVQYGQSGEIPLLAPYFYRQLANVTATPTIALNPADDSSHGQDITNVTRPRVTGVTSAGAQISLINVSTGSVIGSGYADTNGNYSVVPTNPLTDGTYQLEVKASGLNNVSLTSKVLTLTIDTSLKVVSISPANGSYNTGLSQVVVTFNHPLAGLTPNDPTGNGFAGNPYAVFLGPEGPSGSFSAPSGIDGGTVPLHGTLVYSVNSDGTSQITLTPTVPLGTNIYLVSIAGLTDLAGNPLQNSTGTAGPVYATMEIRTTPFNTSAVSVASVTANQGGVTINNNLIAQPDTIGIAFNKAMDALTINNNTVQLFASEGGSYVLQPAAVAYSPTTQTAYLTPETILYPGTVYVVSVSGSVTDDLDFPSLGDPLGANYYDTFMVTNNAVASQTPLKVVGTSPANGTLVTQPLGYGAVKFSEALNLSPAVFGRYSAMLIPNPGPPNNFVPLNDQLAFNPNTNQLIIVPTVPLGNATYVFSLSNLSATDGDLLNGPVYSTFGYQASGLSASSVSQGAPMIAAESVPVATSTTTTANPTTAATNVPVTATSAPAAVPKTARVRPAQAAAKARDAALEEAISSVHALLSARRRALTSGVEHLAGSHARRKGAKS